MKVAKLGKQNLEITETRHELKDSRIRVHVKDVETQKLERNSRNIKGRHERLRVNRDDLAKELEKDKHDWKKSSETLTRLEEFGDFEDLLTFRRPNPCYMPTLDATFVSCHLFDVFPTATIKKICLFKTIVCIVCISLYLSYLTPNPWTQ